MKASVLKHVLWVISRILLDPYHRAHNVNKGAELAQHLAIVRHASTGTLYPPGTAIVQPVPSSPMVSARHTARNTNMVTLLRINVNPASGCVKNVIVIIYLSI